MNQLIWQHRKLFFWNSFLSVLNYSAIYILVISILYITVAVYGDKLSLILEDSFVSGFTLAIITTILAYFTYFIQARKTKRESTTKEYYEGVIIPLFLELKNQKDLLQNGAFDELDNKLVNIIPYIKLEYLIPTYLKKELINFDNLLSSIVKNHSQINSLFYKNALPLEKNNIVGIEIFTGMDYLKRYIIDKENIFTYSFNDDSEMSRSKNKEYNLIMLDKMNKEKVFIECIKNINGINSSIQCLNSYFNYIIKKSIKRLI